MREDTTVLVSATMPARIPWFTRNMQNAWQKAGRTLCDIWTCDLLAHQQ